MSKFLKATFIIVIITLTSYYFLFHNNVSYLKNQKTIVNFLEKNRFSLDLVVDLAHPFFQDFYKSDYKLFVSGDLYYLNNSLSGIINVGFDHLKFKEINLSFVLENNDLYFRFNKNTFDQNLDLKILDLLDWQYLNLLDLNLDLIPTDFLTYVAIKDGLSDSLIFYPSAKLVGLYPIMDSFISDFQLILEPNIANLVIDEFVDFSLVASDFAGYNPISKPNKFDIFLENL